MGVSKDNDRYVGHSDQSSLGDALQDAVNQALADQPGADGMIEYEVLKIRGRSGGFAGFRDVWVEISVGEGKAADNEKDKDKDKYTTLAIGEEGGQQVHDLGPGMSTRALGEEGGVDGQSYSTMAVGEEGGGA